jgi:hypothetical protein
MMKLLLVLIPALAICACGPEKKCLVNETRCSGVEVQVCESDGRWATFMDCDEVSGFSGGQWDCAPLEDGSGHTCLPVPTDATVDGGER